MADERFIPGTSRITEIESFHRYLAAAELCRGKKVLDAASGEGYGTDILASAAEEVTGIDICDEAVEQARRKYTAPNLTFVCGDALALPFPDGTFDCVVTFETIEHVSDPERLLAEIARVLKPSGFVILSSPNKAAFDRRNHCENGENIYHKTEMECDDLVNVMKRIFPHLAVYAQDSFFSSQIGGDSAMRYFVKNSGEEIIRQRALVNSQYSIILGGKTPPPVLLPSSYIDAHYDGQFGYQPDDESIVNQFGLRGDFERAYAELEEKRGQLTALNGDLERSRERENSLAGQLQAEQEDTRKLAAERDSIRRELDDEKNAHQASRDHLQAAENDLAGTRSQAAALQHELDFTQQRLGEEQGNAAKLQSELVDTKGKAVALQNELDSTKQRLGEEQGASAKLQSELADTKGRAAALQNELESTRLQLGKEQSACAKLQKDLADTGGLATALQSELKFTQQRLDTEKSVCRKLQNQNSILERNLDNTMKKAQSLQLELGSAQRQLADEQNAHHKLQEQHAVLEGDLADERDHTEVLQHDLEEVRLALEAARHELEQTRTQLAASENNVSALNTELTTLRGTTDAAISDLNRRLGEEHAKAEYLWHEYNQIRSAWSLRIFGRFHLRRKFRNLGLLAGRLLFNGGKGFVDHLPIRYETRIRIKNAIYGNFGFCFRSAIRYNEWRSYEQRKKSVCSVLTPGAGLEVPADLPLTSIIIPVYNNLKYTLGCLHAIYAIRSKAPFEVIVVDDCSTEDYSVLRREYPKVKVLRNERNSGFLRTVNRGAREAAGEYVLILNNDTEVLPGWLDELATALYHHAEAGMIGSQLIHMRTGTLQESGNLICRNGQMLPLGRGSAPDHPEFSYFREVDFVSAASIILRKSVFDEMNGFDDCYAPAYFEDPDLGLRLQRAGYHNYVMPLSRVMHMEMASYGDSLNSRCENNRKFFFDRWRDYLAQHALYDTPQDSFNCRKYRHERLLYIDAEMPMADRGSGGMDAIFFMNYFLKRGFDVVFHGEYTPGGVPKYTEILLRMGVECVYLPERKIWEYLESSGWTFSWLFISRIYQAQCFDRLLKKYCPQARYIFDTVDVHFVREQLEAELHDDPKLYKQAARTKQFELAVARSADATIVISRDEKKLLEEQYGLTNVWHIPQARAIAGRQEGVRRKGAVFIGSAHPPNMDGLRYFHDEILPLLPRDFKLTVIGEALRDVMKKLPEYRDLLKCRQFDFVGFVPDLGDVLNTAMLSVAPLRYGAGTKGKVASSMSYGVPCVSSSFGAEGTGMVHGKNILLAQTPEEFAQEIRALCTDPELWKKISDGGLEFLKNEYDPGKVDAEMDELFAHVRSSRKSDWAETPVIPKQEELEAL